MDASSTTEQLIVDADAGDDNKSPRTPFARVRQRRQSTGSLRNEVKRRVRLLVPSNHIVRERISIVAGVNRKWDSLTKLEWLKLDTFVHNLFPERYAEATALIEGTAAAAHDDYSGGLPELASASAIVGGRDAGGDEEQDDDGEMEDGGDGGDGGASRRVRRRTGAAPDDGAGTMTGAGLGGGGSGGGALTRPIPELAILAKLEEMEALGEMKAPRPADPPPSVPRRLAHASREGSYLQSSCVQLPAALPAIEALRAAYSNDDGDDQVEYLLLARGGGGNAVAVETNMRQSWRQTRRWITEVLRLHGNIVTALDEHALAEDGDGGDFRGEGDDVVVTTVVTEAGAAGGEGMSAGV